MAGPLSNLGQVILDWSANSKAERLKQEDEDRLRQQQLADVADTRSYNDKVREQQNRLQIDSEQRKMQDDVKLQLIHEGLLAPGDIDNQGAVAAAFQEAKRRQVDVLYSDLLNTPDENGNPILTRAQLSDGAAIEAAKAKLSAIKAKQLSFTAEQPHLAQAELTRIRGQSQQVQQQLAALEQKLSQPQPLPDPAAITKRAIELVRASGKPVSDQAVSAMADQAAQDLQNRLDLQWSQDKQDAQIQYNTLHARLADLTLQEREIINQFKVAPTEAAVSPLSQPTAQTPSHQASAAERAAAMAAAIKAAVGTGAGGAGSAAPAPAGTPVNLQPLGGEDPMIASENTRRAARLQELNLIDPNADRIAQINQRIAAIRDPSVSGAPKTLNPWNPTEPLPVPTDPSQRAQTLSSLILELKDLQDKETQRKARVLGMPVAAPADAATRRPLSNLFQDPFSAPLEVAQ